MTARDLTPVERAIRVIVAQHLPSVEPDRAAAYAEKIHLAEPLHRIGLTDGAYVAATLAIERAYGFDLPDDVWESAKCVADIAQLVERHAQAVAA